MKVVPRVPGAGVRKPSQQLTSVIQAQEAARGHVSWRAYLHTRRYLDGA
jgi:hypothetical protein